MAQTDINQTTTSDLHNEQSDFSVDSMSLDSPLDQDETTWQNSKWTTWLGYYKQIPELKQAVDALAMWTCGKGWKTPDVRTKVILDHLTGWGEDSFQSIMENMIVVKKINGDAYAEIIRDKDTGILINLKPLSPANMKIIVGRDGLIKRYEYEDGHKKVIKFKPEEIFHISNDRIADEIHGVSVVESCENVILARNEAITDWQKVLHRNINPLKIFMLDTDKPTEIEAFKTQYHNMVKDYEAIFVPKGNAELQIPSVPLQDPTLWIRYLENFFYQAVGVPKIILGGAQEFTEASSKIGYLTFEQIYMREQRLLESDLWNKLGFKVEFERPVSLKEAVQESEEANTGQVGFQQNELNPQVTKNE